MSSKQRNIVAIGGGSLALKETLPLDELIVSLTETRHPKALFIPTASDDDESYCNNFSNIYSETFECEVEYLLLYKEKYSSSQIEEKILTADLIYVGGGNTKAMVKLWREMKVDVLLRRAWAYGTVLSGLSAGANCWFTACNSDAPQYEGRTDILTERVHGIGLIELTVCPHMKNEEMRFNEFSNMIRGSEEVAIGIDDHCALHIQDENYRFVSTREEVFGHLLRWQNDYLNHIKIQPGMHFSKLNDLQQGVIN